MSRKYIFKTTLTAFISTILFVAGFCGISFAERFAVAVPIANVRSGPGTNYDIFWEVEKYHPIFVVEKSGSWYHFRDFEDDKGWVHVSLVRKIRAVITKKDSCHVRSGPGKEFNILFKVEKGIPFRVIKHDGEWIHIQHADGDEGWIHKSLVW